jgi:hypothetical protein
MPLGRETLWLRAASNPFMVVTPTSLKPLYAGLLTTYEYILYNLHILQMQQERRTKIYLFAFLRHKFLLGPLACSHSELASETMNL